MNTPAKPPPRLHIAGCGRAARVLARLWHTEGALEIGRIANRTPDSARAAAEFVGAGRPVGRLGPEIAGDWLLLGLPDSRLAGFARELSGSLEAPPALAFHLSGGVPSGVLSPLGCPVASVHPVRPFAEPGTALAGFSGTWCVAEGDEAALAALGPAFAAIGGRFRVLGAGDKALYHAATVAASNYLVALNALARDLAGAAGLDSATAAGLLDNLQRATLSDLSGIPPAGALTGPVERGDAEACRRLVEAVARGAPQHLEAFRAGGRATLALARLKHPESPAWDRIERLFSG